MSHHHDPILTMWKIGFPFFAFVVLYIKSRFKRGNDE